MKMICPAILFETSSKYSPLVAMHLRDFSIDSRKEASKIDVSIFLNDREKFIGRLE
jgi:hypothetical protein